MSSFVIGLEEYIKVGAFIGAFSEVKDRHNDPVLCRIITENGNYRYADINWYVQQMKDLYKVNVESVVKQYELEDTEEEKDYYKVLDFDFTNLIEEYKGKAKKSKNNKDYMLNVILELDKFFHCVEYQIEYDSTNLAKDIIGNFRRYLFTILTEVYNWESDNWGEFNISGF